MPLMCESHKDRRATSVCHHCGRPLCELIDLSTLSPRTLSTISKIYTLDKLCGYLLQDEDFSIEPDRESVLSCHCDICLKANHPEMVSALENLRARLSYQIHSLQ